MESRGKEINKVNTRAVILDALLAINENDEYSHRVMRSALRKYQYLPSQDRAFISRVTLGTVERRMTLDYMLDRFAKTPVRKMKPVIRNILRMGAYQICYMDSVEDYAVCDEAVKLAVKRGFAGLKGFVNGVLRNLARSYRDIRMPDLATAYSTPQWLVDRWIKDYGPEVTEGFLASQYVNYPMWIRVNTTKITPEDFYEKLTAKGICLTRDDKIPEAMTMEHYDYLEGMPEWQQGLFFVQDYVSMQVAHMAQVREGMQVIDVCAAPGGKSTHIAEKMNGTGFVDARDVSEEKVGLIEENIRRLGLTNIRARIMDATVPDEGSREQADLVIADLPCSGLGILNKKPDIKYHADVKRCEELVLLQREILKVVSQYVKPDGIMMYSTCTINKSENEENASWAAKNLGFTLLEQKQFLPGTEGNPSGDGFFIAKLIKNRQK